MSSYCCSALMAENYPNFDSYRIYEEAVHIKNACSHRGKASGMLSVSFHLGRIWRGYSVFFPHAITEHSLKRYDGQVPQFAVIFSNFETGL